MPVQVNRCEVRGELGIVFAMLGCDRVKLPMNTFVVDLDRVSAKACQSTLAQSLTGPDAIHLGI